MNGGTRNRCAIALAMLGSAAIAGCSVSPAPEDQSDFLTRSIAQSAMIERTTPDIRKKLEHAAAYILFPDAVQWGTLMGGGQWARGAVFTPRRNHIGWAAINTTSLGIQAGFAACRILIIVKDQPTLRALRFDMLSAGMTVSGVVGPGGAIRNPTFEDGFEIFIIDQAGLLVGVSASLQWIRYEDREPDRARNTTPAPGTVRPPARGSSAPSP